MVFKKKVLAILIPIAFSQIAFAADEAAKDIKIKAEKVIVKGILPEKLEAVPGSFSVVNSKELIEKQPFSVKEALNAVPGVNFVTAEDPMSFALNIGIRGLDPRRTSRTLLMEDGVPLHLAPYGDPSAHYSTPLDRVDRIEVVKGSGQILYGPQTVGGMINFVTKPVPRNGFAGSASAIFGNNDFNSQSVNLGFGNERGGVMIDAIKKQGDGVRKNHKFDIQEYTLKGEVDLTDRHSLMTKLGYYKEDSNVSETGLGSLDYAQDKFQAPTGANDRFQHERKSIQLKHVFKIDEAMKLSTNAYYIDSWRSSFRQTDTAGGWDDGAPGASTGFTAIDRDGGANCVGMTTPNACGGRHRPRSYQVWGVEPRLDFSHKLFGLENDTVIGLRYHEEKIKRNQFRSDEPEIINNLGWGMANAGGLSEHRESLVHKVESKAAYVQNTFHVGDWSLTPGLRFEDYKVTQTVLRAGSNPVDSDGGTGGDGLGLSGTKSQSEILPGFGLAWNGISNTTVFGGIHRGFAPARPDRDLTKDGAGRYQLDKTTPELSTNYEVGARSKYFKGVSFESTLFHTKFDDIVVKGASGTYVNAGAAEMSGLEFAGRVDFGTIYNTPHNFYTTASYTNLFTAKFKKDGLDSDDGVTAGQRLAYAPKQLISLNFGYQHPVGFNARIGADHVSEQEPDAYTKGTLFAPGEASLAGYGGTIPSYTLFNASASFKPVGSKLTYFVSGTNLGDKEYLASRVDGMFAGRSRQVFGGIKVDF
jgi:Fe(3+) dicitrate transport protein